MVLKRILCTAVFLILLVQLPIKAQGGTTLYLPIITKEPFMSNWFVVVPEATTNKVLNPSFETTGNFAAAGGGSATRSTSYQKFGLYSLRVQTSANNDGVDITLGSLANDPHYVSLFVRGTIPPTWDWSLDGATFTSPTLLKSIDSNWNLYGLNFPTAQATGSTTLSIYQNGAGAGDFYIDAVQVEQKDGYRTTYCDGTQDGCEWNGAKNASTSTRSALSRAGGRVYDLQDDYYLNIGQVVGAGAVPQRLGLDSYAILPGGELNNLKIQSRVFTLTGVINASSQADFHDKEQNLYDILSDAAYPGQPVLLRYEGGTVHKEIAAFYEGGLESDISATDPCYWERVAIRFNAPDPFWYEIGNSAAVLDTNDSATFRIVAGRLRSTGQWDNLGPPDAAGTYTYTLAIEEDDTYVYFAGSFSNFDNIGAADNIVRYNKQTGAYSALDVGLNNTVWYMTKDSNGDLIIVGEFTNAGGDADADYICRWDGTNFSAIGVPNTGTAAITRIYGVTVDLVGDIIVTGQFTDLGNVANADYIAKYDISATAWVAVGVPNTGAAAITSLRRTVVDADNQIYVVGQFTDLGNVSGADYIARFNGTAWESIGFPYTTATLLRAIAISPTGELFFGGSFTAPTGNYVIRYNGTSFFGLGNGLNGTVIRMRFGPDGILWLSGGFTESGNIDLPESIAGWNGSTFFPLDINLSGTPVTVYDIYPSQYTDPEITQKYNIYLGYDQEGTNYYGGLVTVNSDGSISYPTVNFYRSGGTSALVSTLINEGTNKKLSLSYNLLNGETLTIDTSPKSQSAISDFFGSRQEAIINISDLGSFAILNGSNDITSFVDVVGGPTITAWLEWRQAYSSY